MCGRFDVDARDKEIRKLLAELPPDNPQVKLGQVFPSEMALTLAEFYGDLRPQVMGWGFPRWNGGNGVIFNARAESALQKPMFARPLRKNPMIVPVSSFYEWRHNDESGKKERFIFKNPDGGLLYLAGFWNNFPDEAMPRRFTLLTTEANASMAPYHNRMPVLLEADELEAWGYGENLSEILSRKPFELLAAPG